MASMVLSRSPLTTRVRDALRDAGLSCEVGRVPPPASGERTPATPYVVVYPTGNDTFSVDTATLYAPEVRGTFTYQTSTVGTDAQQVEMMADYVRKVLVDRNPDGSFVTSLDSDGLVVTGRWTSGPETIQSESPLFTVPELFTFAAEVAA